MRRKSEKENGRKKRANEKLFLLYIPFYSQNRNEKDTRGHCKQNTVFFKWLKRKKKMFFNKALSSMYVCEKCLQIRCDIKSI